MFRAVMYRRWELAEGRRLYVLYAASLDRTAAAQPPPNHLAATDTDLTAEGINELIAATITPVTDDAATEASSEAKQAAHGYWKKCSHIPSQSACPKRQSRRLDLGASACLLDEKETEIRQ
jgi:hypothetical protein